MCTKHIYVDHPKVTKGISVNIFCEDDYESVYHIGWGGLAVYQPLGII